jgi:hypothetical protein
MLYVRDPDDDEVAELKCMTRQAIGRVSQRAQMVLLSAQHRSVPELAAIFDLHPLLAPPLRPRRASCLV